MDREGDLEFDQVGPQGVSQEPQKPQPPQPPMQGYQQYYAYPPPKRRGNIANRVLKDPTYIGIGIAISIFLIWLGLLFQALVMGSTSSDQIRILREVGIIIYNLGIASLVIILLFLGLERSDYPQWVRVALIAGAVILVLWGFINLYGIFTYLKMVGAPLS